MSIQKDAEELLRSMEALTSLLQGMNDNVDQLRDILLGGSEDTEELSIEDMENVKL